MSKSFDLSTVFDRSALRPVPRGRLLGEALSLLASHPVTPDPHELPHGRELPVLVIPAFLTDDRILRRLHRFLTRCHFRPFGWKLGVNWGPTPRLLDGAEQRLLLLSQEFGPVCVVGVSMGGLFARNLALDHPESVRHVVTLATPYRLPTASTIEPLVRLFARNYSLAVDPARLQQALGVPSTSVYTRNDGLVDWESCHVEEPLGQAVEVTGTHLTIASNPEALKAVVRRLAGSAP